jgi:tripartite-type tricarboxylate transporter receptor subunit TctC
MRLGAGDIPIIIPAQAGIQVVTWPAGPDLRCFASIYDLDSGLRRNDGVENGMTTWRKLRLLSTTMVCFIAAAGILAAAAPAVAQSYPTKPIRLIVPFATGGQSDIIARVMAQKLSESFKQSVIVDNRPAGSGTVGTETAVRANPDGYTLLMASAAYATNAALYPLTYDPVNDVAAISLIGESGFVVSLHPSVPASSVKELIAYDKANSGKLNYGSGGTGGSNHLVTEYFNLMAGTRMTHVPYKGGGPALNDLLGGQIQVFVGTLSAMIPSIKANRVRGLAVTTAKRANALPDVPAVAETVPGYEAVTWAAMLGPKALPATLVAQLNGEISRILQSPDVKVRMAGLGMDIAGGAPERVRDVLRREIAVWKKVVKAANIKIEG